MTKLRLDTLLAQRGLFASRARAAASVMAGEVRLGGSDGERAAKPGQLVAEDVEVAVDERPRFVSRGGIKLANALARDGHRRRRAPLPGRRRLDRRLHRLPAAGRRGPCRRARRRLWGARLGAAHRRSRHGDRAHERAHAGRRRPALRPRSRGRRRLLHLADQGAARGARLLRGALRRAGDGQAAVRGRARAGGQGRRRALARATAARRSSPSPQSARAQGAAVLGFASSGLPGPKGNQETFVWLAEGGRAAARRRPRGPGPRGRAMTGPRTHGDRALPRPARADRRGAAPRSSRPPSARASCCASTPRRRASTA